MRNAGFGDGYVQRAADGLNTKLVSWDLVWSALATANADTIEAFFDGLLGYQAFLYTVSGDSQRKYTASGFTRVQAQGRADSISVTITQVFDP